MPSALIAYRGTLGLEHDSLVLAEALRATACAGGSVHRIALPDQAAWDPLVPVDVAGALSASAPFDCLFLLEHIHANPPLLHRGLARRVVLVPNLEWMLPDDEAALAAGAVDAVAHKSAFSHGRFQELPCAQGVALSMATGWSSLDCADGAPSLDDERYGHCLHVGGVAAQKSTDLVLRTWLRRPDFPPLDVVRRVLPDPTSFLRPLRLAPNVTVHLRHLPRRELAGLHRRCGIHVCPSFAEGFGHTLNEARASAAVLLTTDGDPMRELVVHGETGFLVPTEEAAGVPAGRSLGYTASEDGLARAVERLLSLPPARRREMGERARQAYLADRARFHDRIMALWRALDLPTG